MLKLTLGFACITVTVLFSVFVRTFWTERTFFFPFLSFWAVFIGNDFLNACNDSCSFRYAGNNLGLSAVAHACNHWYGLNVFPIYNPYFVFALGLSMM